MSTASTDGSVTPAGQLVPARLAAVIGGVTLRERYRIGNLPVPHRGMGEVWQARDVLLDRQGVVKFLTSHTGADPVRRFRREALLTARLTHPGAPRIFDLGEHAGRPYLVLELIDGVTLAD